MFWRSEDRENRRLFRALGPEESEGGDDSGERAIARANRALKRAQKMRKKMGRDILILDRLARSARARKMESDMTAARRLCRQAIAIVGDRQDIETEVIEGLRQKAAKVLRRKPGTPIFQESLQELHQKIEDLQQSQ